MLMLPHKTTPFRLKIVRQTVEQGKPVVYFRVEGGEGKRIFLGNFERVYDDTIDGAADRISVLRALNKESHLLTDGFWAPSQRLPMHEQPSNARKEFGVLTPRHHQGWKLRVTVFVAEHSISGRLRMKLACWRSVRKAGFPLLKAVSAAWNAVAYPTYQIIESDLMTNPVSESATVSKNTPEMSPQGR